MKLEPLTVAGKPENLGELLDYVAWAAAAFGLDSVATYRLSLAIDEIATNIVLHGYQQTGITGDLTVRAEMDEGEFRLSIEDTGVPFDPRQAPRPTNLDRPLEERGEGGLGIYLALWAVMATGAEFSYAHDGRINRSMFAIRKHGQK